MIRAFGSSFFRSAAFSVPSQPRRYYNREYLDNKGYSESIGVLVPKEIVSKKLADQESQDNNSDKENIDIQQANNVQVTQRSVDEVILQVSESKLKE